MSGRQRNLRKKRDRDEVQEDAEDQQEEVKRDHLEDLKALQKLRKRAAGIDAGTLAVGADAAEDAEARAAAAENELMDAYVKAQEGAKSNLQDEEAHMQQFIEQELAKRLGKDVNGGSQQLSKQELEEQELYAVPEELKASLTKEVSIPGLITAITEVEVSTEAKMKKIEETEAMKANLLTRTVDGPGASGKGNSSHLAMRREFARSFGKQQRVGPIDPDVAEQQARMLPKVISEKRPFPKTGLSLAKTSK